MMLYEEIIFLQHHAKCKWVIENVKPYYQHFIEAMELGRHLFWSNFRIEHIDHKSSDIRKLSGTSKRDKRIRNMVDPKLGQHILNCAMNIETPGEQGTLF